MAKQIWYNTDFYTIEKSNIGNIRVKPYLMYKDGKLVQMPYRSRLISKRTRSVWIVESAWGRWVEVDDIRITDPI